MMQIPSKAFKFGPVALTTTLTTNIVSPPSPTGGVGINLGEEYIELYHISIVNKDIIPRTFSLWLGASNANAAGTEILGIAIPIGANSSFEWYGQLKINLGEYLVGGASANTSLSIIGEGQIVFSPMPRQVQLASSYLFISTNNTPTDAYAGIRIHSDGTIDGTPTNASTLTFSVDLGPWLVSGSASDYEARMTDGGPDNWSGDAMGTWLNLGTTRIWYSVTTVIGTLNINNGPLEIRKASTQQILATATVGASAEEAT